MMREMQNLLFLAVVSCVVLVTIHIMLSRLVLAARDDISPQKTLVKLVLALNLPLVLVTFLLFVKSNIGVADTFWAIAYVLCVFNGFGYAYFHFFNLSETGRRIRLLMRLRELHGAYVEQLETNYSTEQMVRVRLQRLEQMHQIDRTMDNRFNIKGRLLLRVAKVFDILGSILFIRHNHQQA